MIKNPEKYQILAVSTNNLQPSTVEWLHYQVRLTDAHGPAYQSPEFPVYSLDDSFLITSYLMESLSSDVPKELYTILEDAYLDGYDMVWIDPEANDSSFTTFKEEWDNYDSRLVAESA